MDTKFLVAFGVLAAFLFLAPADGQAQQDDKDVLIEQQKKQIDNLKKNAEIYEKRIELQEKLSKAVEETHKKEIELWEKQTKAQPRERFLQEINTLNQTIREREALVVKFEAEVKRIRTIAVQTEPELRGLEGKIAHLEKGEKAGVEPNPPPASVKGKIEKLEGDLMRISLGTDHGVRKNHTLDVYRLQPEPKYLGMIRVVDANAGRAVARPNSHRQRGVASDVESRRFGHVEIGGGRFPERKSGTKKEVTPSTKRYEPEA